MGKLYSVYESLNVPTASITGILHTGRSQIYQKDDNYWYQKDDSQVERRIIYDLGLGSGLTQSLYLENVIAPYGSVISTNIGTGLTMSGPSIVVDKISLAQISATNSPVANDSLIYNGSELEWSNKTSIYNISKAFGISCGVGFTPVGTHSYDGSRYTLKIICVYTSTDPLNEVAPVVSGYAVTGQVLSTTDGTWLGPGPITYSYVWQRSLNGIDWEDTGTIINAYTLTDLDYANSIRCVVIASNTYSIAYGYSNVILDIKSDKWGSNTPGNWGDVTTEIWG